MYSRTTLFRSTATGFRSVANASAPTRSASSGIAPPPANGSITSGRVEFAPPRHSCAHSTKARLIARKSLSFDRSQLAKSAMKSRRPCRMTFGSSSSCGSSRIFSSLGAVSEPALLGKSLAHRFSHSRDSVRNRSGQPSPGSGQRPARMTARHAASGRRAHQMWRVEMCPCRIDFSRCACWEIRRIGRSTSMRRLG